MLRIVFSRDDVARTRVAPGADPLWELVLSLHLLRRPSLDPVLAGWRGGVREGLRGHAEMRSFYAINPSNGYFPDFLTPHDGIHGLDAGLDAIRSTPKRRIHHELSLIDSPPSGLARGEVPAVVQLTDAMKRYQEIAITPYLPQIRTAVEADRARRARTMLDSGAEGLLTGLHPGIQWGGGVLEVSNYPTSRELRLDGRGLLLVPSFFCCGAAITLVDPTLPPVLVYPVDRLGGLASRASGGALAALVGRTRAQVLEVVGDGALTSEVARRLGISPAAASQHTTVLRNAGLLLSQRDRNTVRHMVTPLGRALLNPS
ncbi:ArsR/SmtB family transcription factor [Micromonospora sp. CPCC 206061]|uniref:ArsR/SmtB family transcription factor n=1 Tax=Micromonospora sp. CPCC 206061 TaxID=3122410 RepID=UPI002FF417E2